MEECGYIAGRVRLYCWKSAVILPEECGYIAGRVRLYVYNKNSGHLRLSQLPQVAHALRSDQFWPELFACAV